MAEKKQSARSEERPVQQGRVTSRPRMEMTAEEERVRRNDRARMLREKNRERSRRR